MTLPPEQLEAIRARAEAATYGPWRVVPVDEAKERWDVDDTLMVAMEKGAPICFVDEHRPDVDAADAEFIAHARADVPALLAHAKEQAARIEASEREAADVRNLGYTDLL